MSSSMRQGILTCFEPLREQPRVLGLAMFPHVQPSFPSPASTVSPTPVEFPPSQIYDGVVRPVTRQDGQVYVHPLTRGPASVLSDKSLKMCTESLGSETGGCDFLAAGYEMGEFQRYPIGGELRELKGRKGNRSGLCKFPPPLKSMSSSSVVRMRPCRVDGRLVLQAVGVSSCRNSFLVERGGGRLRLSLSREEDATDDGEKDGARATNEGVGQEGEDGGKEESYEIGKEEEKAGRGRRRSRCKEGKGLLNWKLWSVAT